MFAYMTAEEAKELGFTNHGLYFGIPCWIAEDGPDGLMVEAKWIPMNHVMNAFHYIEGFIQTVMGLEPGFNFKVGPEI